MTGGDLELTTDRISARLVSGRGTRGGYSLVVGGTTQSVYIAVPDADAVFARAKAAGAEIVMGLTDQPYGSRDFICRDPEGQVWCFGTYAPRP